ncbi:MAG: hypothetical protein RSC06_09910, partial [Clostridia bacterium]
RDAREVGDGAFITSTRAKSNLLEPPHAPNCSPRSRDAIRLFHIASLYVCLKLTAFTVLSTVLTAVARFRVIARYRMTRFVFTR